MNVQDRLMQFLKYKKLSKLAFSNSINRSSSYVTNIVHTIGADSRKAIQQVYPELNMDWLIDGVGEMLNEIECEKKDEEALLSKNTVLVIPMAAQAGRLTEYTEAIKESDCEKMISPINGVDFAIPVTGDSMSPEYPSGSKVLVAKINEKAFIDWGRTYVLDTCNGIVIKNIYPSENEGYVKCVSVNPNFPSFEVNTSDIYGWYKVLMSLSLK